MSKLILPDNPSSNSSSSSSPYFRSNTNTSQPPHNPASDSTIIYELCSRVSFLESENKSIKQHISKEVNFYKSISRLSNTAIVFLFALPVVQLLIISILVYFLRDDSTFINYLKGGFADVKQRLKKYELFKPTYEGAVPGNPGTAPPVIQLYSPAQSTGQFHQRNDR